VKPLTGKDAIFLLYDDRWGDNLPFLRTLNRRQVFPKLLWPVTKNHTPKVVNSLLRALIRSAAGESLTLDLTITSLGTSRILPFPLVCTATQKKNYENETQFHSHYRYPSLTTMVPHKPNAEYFFHYRITTVTLFWQTAGSYAYTKVTRKLRRNFWQIYGKSYKKI